MFKKLIAWLKSLFRSAPAAVVVVEDDAAAVVVEDETWFGKEAGWFSPNPTVVSDAELQARHDAQTPIFPQSTINYMGFKPFPGATQYDYDRLQLKKEGFDTTGFKSSATKAEREQYQLDWEAFVARGRPVVPPYGS